MSKEQLLEKLSEIGRNRGIDRDVLRTTVDMFSLFADTLEQNLKPLLMGGQNIDLTEITGVIDTIKAQVGDELHILRNDVDGLDATIKELETNTNKLIDVLTKTVNDLSAKQSYVGIKSSIDEVGKMVVALENRLDKLEHAIAKTPS